MPTYSYNENIPAAANAPKNDQPGMQQNTNSIDSIIGVDHYTFETSNMDGFHQYVRMKPTASPALVDGATCGLFATTINGQSWPAWANEAGQTSLLSYVTSEGNNGYCSLPGGLLIQWGRATASSSSSQQNFTFPTAFPNNCFVVVPNPTYSGGIPGGAASVAVRESTINKTGFSFLYQTNASNYTGFTWVAIGK